MNIIKCIVVIKLRFYPIAFLHYVWNFSPLFGICFKENYPLEQYQIFCQENNLKSLEKDKFYNVSEERVNIVRHSLVYYFKQIIWRKITANFYLYTLKMRCNFAHFLKKYPIYYLKFAIRNILNILLKVKSNTKSFLWK